MAKPLYCWRCDCVLPMLDEEEWARLEPLLVSSIENVQRYRHRHDAPLSDVPIAEMYWAAAEMFSKLTGVDSVAPEALWHHRLANYGPPCAHCGKPLRTSRAKLCAVCGHLREAAASD